MGVELRISDVSKTYGSNVGALGNVNLSIGSGVFGLLGPNGAGKTTLLRLVATLMQPTSGTIAFNGCDSMRDRVRYRAQLGYLPQKFGLHAHLTALEHVLYCASLKGIRGARGREEAVRLLHEVGLDQVSDQPVGTFSGGMKQRVGIAGALAGSPPLLVVDEPTAGLDPEERIRFRTILETVSRDAVVVLSTHILQDVEMDCSQVAIVGGGRIVAKGTPSELTELARGKSWLAEVSPEQCADLKRVRTVTSARELPDGSVRVRFVGDAAGMGETAADPQLIDAYLGLTRQAGDDAWL